MRAFGHGIRRGGARRNRSVRPGNAAVVACRAIAVTLLAAAPASAQPAARLTSLVNPFIGTGGHGHTYPGPSLPFGMIQPGPDTRLEDWDGSSGYHYGDSRILGFSHTHLSGTGIPDYCDVLLAPTTGELHLDRGDGTRPGYSSAFRHADEAAAPGYYAVTLSDHGVRAELTTTLRVGLHRYTFPAGRPAHVVLDLVHRDEVLDAWIEIGDDGEVRGLRRSTGWAQDQRVYFVMRFSRAALAHGVAEADDRRPGGRAAKGRAVKAWFDFGDAGGPLLVKVAISAVSVEGARRNLEAELPGWNFGAVRAAASDAWERELSKIRVEGGSARRRTIFYTALYHAMLTPNVFMDVDGQYLGRDLEVHRADRFTYYTVFSLWDTFRALHPLLAIIDAPRTRDFVRTMLQQYREGGRLPVWELAANETDTMIGYHAVPVVADAILKDLGGFDVELAYAAMTRSADADRFGLAAYKRLGYVPAEEERESVSKTLEYAFDDWCLAMVARKLGRPDDHARYLRRAQAWKHLFDPATGFLRARLDGFWFAPFDPAEVNAHYTEANAWQYRFFVPHDIEGLMRALGGRDAFARALDALFGADSRISGIQQADITGMIGQYAHGNEPSHHVPYLYAFAGQPWKTQAMVRRIIDTQYGSGPEGLAGNDDCGQLSAWLVLSALGFYPVAPGAEHYVLGTPLFPEATIALEGGRRFVIRAPRPARMRLVAPGGQGLAAVGLDPDPSYVREVRLNGQPWGKAFLRYASLAAGGELAFDLSPTAVAQWASGPQASPPSAVDEHSVTPAPFVVTGTPLFRGSTTLALGHVDPDAEIRVTSDGTDPTASSARYDGPLTLGATATVKAVAWLPGRPPSSTLTVRAHRVPDGLSLSLSAAYAPRYHGGGELALVDGRRGGPDFRLGRWQGYLGQDLEATLDLGTPREIRAVGMGFLQDARSWILLPRRVGFAISDDGAAWREVGAVENDVPPREPGVVLRDLTLRVAPTRARYLRVRVEHAGPLPAWHPGAGEPSWFFADEILIEPPVR